MIDPDAPSRRDPKNKEYLHFLAVNVGAAQLNVHSKDVDVLCEYMGPMPPEKSGVLVVYALS